MGKSAAKPKSQAKATNKKVVVKPLVLARLRCAADHKDPWLGRLYVIWAPAPQLKDGEMGPPAPPQFSLGQTNKDGYLSPLKNDQDPDPIKTQPLFADVEYLFLFVRHPERSLPDEILKAANANDFPHGQPKKMKLAMEVTGKDKKKKEIKELVLKIPEDPDYFVPKGSDFYGKWVLFRGMPNAACEPVVKQIKRLQFHLGTMRYPIGGHGHPYSPARLIPTKKDPYSELGFFDVITWNSVLAFQRDLKDGKAAKLKDTAVYGKFVSGADFEPTGDAADAKFHIQEARNFIEATPVSGAATGQTSPPYETVVDAKTGDAVKHWLKNHLRKPGPVLISQGTFDTWMDSRAQPDYDSWSKRLKAFGFTDGIKVSNVLRDVRIGVQTGGGMVATSIHKSGFALDLTMDWGSGKLTGKYPYPLYYERDNRGSSVYWKVYALIEDSKLPSGLQEVKDAAGNVIGYKSADAADTDIQYLKTIQNWVYDPNHADGGTAQALTIAGKTFLNVTNIAKKFGFTNISAHKTGWQLEAGSEKFKITDNDSLNLCLKRLWRHIKHLKSRVSPGDSELKIGSTSVMTSAYKSEIEYLSFWLSITGAFGASPEVLVEPDTKAGEMLIKLLKQKFSGNAKYKDRKVKLFYVRPIDATPPAIEAEYPKDGELVIKADTEFHPFESFILEPVTHPLMKSGITVECSPLIGDPPHLEWWHFQWEAGYKGKKWGALLREVGWTAEGLRGKTSKTDPGIYGYHGIGYTQNDLNKDAK